jgi:hypothetical protein
MQNYATAQQYPMTQLTNLKSLLSGLPVTDVTTTQETAAPSTLAGVASLGTAATAANQLANSSNNSAGSQALFNQQMAAYQAQQAAAANANANTGGGAKAGGIIKAKKAKRYAVGGAVGSVESSLEVMDDNELANVIKTSTSPFIRQHAQELLAQHQADPASANSRGVASAPATSRMFSAAGGGIVAFDEGGGVPSTQLSPTQQSTNTWLDFLQQKGFGQPTQADLDLQEQNKQAYIQGLQNQNDAKWWGLLQGAGQGMQNTSPYAMVGLGKLLSGTAQGISENEKQAADQLAKIRAGELDANKLSSTDRNNLLHYTINSATSEETNKLRVKELEDAAKARAQTANLAAQGRNADKNNALFNTFYSANIKAAQDKITGRALTEKEKDDIATQTINQVSRVLQAQGKPGLNTNTSTSSNDVPAPPPGFSVPAPKSS